MATDMTETKAEPTRTEILRAGRLLAGVCDGARTEDGMGYNKFDAPTAKSIVNTPSPTDRQVRSLWHILRKYRKQLEGHGIEFDALIPPPLTPRAADGRFPADRSPVRLLWVQTDYGRRIAVASNGYNPALVAAVKGLPKRWFDKEGKNSAGIKNAWLVPDDLDSLDGALGALEGLEPRLDVEVEPDLKAAMDTVREERRRAYTASRAESADIEIPTKLPLKPFQRAGVKYTEDLGGRALIADEMGLGKTCQGLGYLAKHPEALPALVVCPANLRVNWYREVMKFTEFRPFVISSKTSLKAFQKLGVKVGLAPEPDHDIYIVNYDLFETQTPETWIRMLRKGDESGVPNLLAAGQYALKELKKAYSKDPDILVRKRLLEVIGEIEKQGGAANRRKFVKVLVNGIPLEEFMAVGFKAVVGDELHYCKESDSQRSMATKEIAKPLAVRIGLTGTPILNQPRELWSLLNIINPDIYPDFMSYAMKHCNAFQKPAGRRMVWDFSGASNLEELERTVRARVMIRRTKAQVLKELPEKTRITVPIFLDEKLKAYEEKAKPAMERLRKLRAERDEWRAQLAAMDEAERNTFLTKHAEAAARKGRLSNIMIDEIEMLKQAAVEAKFDDCVKFVLNAQEQQGKVLVFMTHHESIDKMVAALSKEGLKVDRIDGRVPGGKRDPIKDRFQDGDLEVLVCGIRAASEGLNLTACHTVVKVEFDWNPARHHQAEDRVHRIGQTVPPTIYYLVGLGTIEERIAAMIDSKREVVNAALGEGDRTVDETGILDGILEDLLGGKAS